MKRIPVAVVAMLGLAACRTESNVAPNAPGPQAPSFDINDKFHDGGNSNFYFLPPTVPNPGNGADKDKNDVGSAPDVRVTIQAWALSQDPGLCSTDPTPTGAGTSISNCAPTGAMQSGLTKLEVNNSEYKTHWKIPADPTVYYRILVYLDLGTTTKTLGWADIKTGANGGALKGTNTYEYVPKEDKSDLEIKFRIVSQCKNPSSCGERYVDLNGTQPVTVFLGDPAKPTGGVTIPPQGDGGVVKVAVEPCADLPLDIPLFGSCIKVTTDPAINLNEGGGLNYDATVFVCDAVQDASKLPGGASGAQSESVRLHRRDGNDIRALPEGPAVCPQLTGQNLGPADLFRSVVHGNWKEAGQQLAALVSPTPAYARRLHQGGGGNTCCFSDFQNALPSSIRLDCGECTPTGILVKDVGNRPVQNAKVHFGLCGGGEVVVKSDANGFAPFPRSPSQYASGWGLGHPDPYYPSEGAVSLPYPPDPLFYYQFCYGG